MVFVHYIDYHSLYQHKKIERKTVFFIRVANIFLQYFNKVNNVGIFNKKSHNSKLIIKSMTIAFEMFEFQFISEYFITYFTMVVHI